MQSMSFQLSGEGCIGIDQMTACALLIAILSAVFGVLASLLAGIGLYGVMSYVVARDANCLSHGDTRGSFAPREVPCVVHFTFAAFTSRMVVLPGCSSGLRGVPQLQSLRRSSLTRTPMEDLERAFQ